VATTREHEAEISRLQSRLGDLLATLESTGPRAPGYDDAADETFAAAQELIDYEARVPALLDEQPRRISLIVLRAAGAATMLLAAGIALSVIPGGRSWWWLLAAIALAVAGARLLATRVRRTGHERQRGPAVLVAAGALAAAVGAAGLAPFVLLVVALALVTAGLLLGMQPRSVQVRDLSSGQPLGDDQAGRPLDEGQTLDLDDPALDLDDEAQNTTSRALRREND